MTGCRHWLKPRTIVDLKKCANTRERPFDVAVLLAIVEYRYDISARHYLDGFQYLCRFAAERRVFGDCPLRPDWHARIAAPDAMRWTWVFRQTEGAPVTKGLELLAGSSALHRAAREIVEAKQTYLSCLQMFGFGNWDAETVEMKREHEPVQIPPTEEHPKGDIVVTYSARVRVTVYSEDGSRKVVRERSGGHRGFGPTVGQAVEDCIKAAETDATKRAFGNIFGLALYDREQRNVGAPERRQVAVQSQSGIAPIDEGFEPSEPRQQPTTSQRAVAAAKRPIASTPNGRDRALPY